MGDYLRAMQAFGTLPEAAALLADPRPAWIWSADGGRILWANAAGGRRLGAEGLGGLCERRYADSHPLRRDLRNAARIAGPDGVLARLRFLEGPRALPMACRVRRVAGPDGEPGILVVGEASGEGESSEAAAAPVGMARQEAPCGVSEPQAEPALGNGAAPAGAVRSPIPDWLRLRLSTFPPPARQEAPRPPAADEEERRRPGVPAPDEGAPLNAGSERCLAPDSLSPEERAAFEEIAATLGPAGGAAWRGPPRPADNDDAGPLVAAAEGSGPLPGPARPPEIPSAFCGAAAPLPGRADAAAVLNGDAQARLRELASILDIAADGIVILDGEGRVEGLNGGAEALLGIRQAEAAGRPFAELLAPERRPLAMRAFAGVKADGAGGPSAGGRGVEAEADGDATPISITFGRIGGGATDRFCAVLRDLTPGKQAQAELVAARRRAEDASRQKSDFLARVSHEIRTPLNGIIGFTDVIIDERFGPLSNARYREYVRDIRTSGEHVLSLVNDLLDIAKIEAGKLELSFAPVELNQLVRECVMLMQPAAGRGRIILRTSLAAGLPPVTADARTVRQVILNILSNAVKFTGPGGQVIVSTGRDEAGDVVLRLRDTGEGMSEAELVRALEPFRQLGTAPLGDGSGTGLGLPLTKALVEANRASFAISSAKGEGTIVKVGFPGAGLADSA